MRTDQGFNPSSVSVRNPHPIEIFEHAFAPFPPKAASIAGIIKKMRDGFCYGTGIFLGDHPGGFSVLHNILHCREVRDHRRAFASQSFHEDQPKPFLISIRSDDGGEDHDFRISIERGKQMVVYGSQKMNPGTDAETLCEEFQFRLILTAADDPQDGLGMVVQYGRHGLDQVANAFFLNKTSHEQKGTLCFFIGRGGKKVVKIDPHRDNLNASGVNP